MIAGCGRGQQDETREKPNIVLIMADDMGYSDIGCFGGDIDTPVLDKLAADGLRFNKFYNTMRCCPTRAALLTGLYQHQVGMGWMTYDTGIEGYEGDLNNRCVTIAEVLKPAGYRTYMHGKWHVTSHYGHWIDDTEHTSKHNWPLQRGFDRFYGIIDGTSNFFQPFSLARDNDPEPIDMDPGYYFTDAVSDHVVDCIEDTPDGTPFFSYVSYTAPHFPLHAMPEDIKKYKGRFDKGWDALRDKKFNRMVDMGLIDPKWGLSDRDERTGRLSDEEYPEWRLRAMEVYAAMIDRMDQGIGKIVDALERSGKLDNTVIIFISDNGGQAGNIGTSQGAKRYTPITARDGRPMRAGTIPGLMPGAEDTWQSIGTGWANASNVPFRKFKGWSYEGGISSPLVVHWPAGISARGEIREQVGHVMDIMPTCCELAGAEYPETYQGIPILPVEGTSLVSALRENPDTPVVRNTPLFWEHQDHRAVLDRKWKLVAAVGKEWELYDMEADRCEDHNLAVDMPDKLAEMSRMYDEWADRAGVVPWDVVAPARAAASKHVDDLTKIFREKQQK
ncbi:MAG: arylsulfatase [Saprospiraceae bacterium]|nr:arylsulfatase [Saprospiraceae bacterium]